MAVRKKRLRAFATIAVLLSVALGSSICSSVARAEAFDQGTTADDLFNSVGPHAVATSARVSPCQDSIVGVFENAVVRAMKNHDALTCAATFPNGSESPIGVSTYYPADIAAIPAAPLIVFTGGIISNPGMYDSLVRRWVSHGFVVTVPYDFVNSLAYVPLAGLAVAVATNRDPGSALHNKIDLSRTIFAGHSGGGQATLQASSLLPSRTGSIDSTLRIIGALAIEPGPLAVGQTLTVPTLFLTGSKDFVVPDFAWVRWWQYNNAVNAPAWIASARDMTHFSPVDGVDHFPAAGTTLAFMRWLALNDENAKDFFVGPDWRLKSDDTYVSAERNKLADEIR